MESRHTTVRRVFAGRTVRFAFAFVVAFWLVLESGRLPEPWYAPLVPFWLPAYLAVAAVSGVRNTLAPWLGSGVLFDAAIVLGIYLEAVLLAGVFRLVRSGYRSVARDEGGPVAR